MIKPAFMPPYVMIGSMAFSSEGLPPRKWRVDTGSLEQNAARYDQDFGSCFRLNQSLMWNEAGVL
jgi:hypothetical protein